MSSLPADFIPLSRAELESRLAVVRLGLDSDPHASYCGTHEREAILTALWVTERAMWAMNDFDCEDCPSFDECDPDRIDLSLCDRPQRELLEWFGWDLRRMEPQP
jgi:hypothetical protein